MKKCPKCGTVLDDSKKKCYMCGADLLRSSITNFGDSFNEQIGATMSQGQDNVFNNVSNISAKVDDVVNGNSGVTFSQKSSSADIYQKQLNNLNSLQYDEKSPLDKIFSNGARDEKNTFDVNVAVKQNNAGSPKNTSPLNNYPNINSSNNQSGNFSPPSNTSNNPSVKDLKKEKKEKPQINWGNNLTSNNDFWNFKDKVNKKDSKISLNFIANIVCFVLFIIGMTYVFFNYVKKPDKANDTFGGLSYVINGKFDLKSNESNTRYYTSGDKCAIRINYGIANNPDSFIESYFEGIKASYEGQDGYTTSTEKMQINGNLWNELSIIEIREKKDSSAGYAPLTKFRHISIVYNANFYDIVYTNLDDDSECTSMYKDFINSLKFD